MDNNEVYALFEDIKSGLKGINNKLENTPKASNSQSGGQPSAMDLTLIKKLLDGSAREHREQTEAMLTKFGEEETHASNRILNLLHDLKESFARSSVDLMSKLSRRNISTATASTSNQAKCFLFWLAWVSFAVFPSGATSSFGSPDVSMLTMP